MNVKILYGKELAAQIKKQISGMPEPKGSLAILAATEDEAALSYVNTIQRGAEKVGIAVKVDNLGPNSSEAEIKAKLSELANDKTITGILVQTPLPKAVDIASLSHLVPTEKDVDGINPANAGRIMDNKQAFAPATATAIIELLKFHNIEISGKHAVVVGRSIVVGKPVANLLINMDATVTICHSKTRNLALHTKQADILVAAVGQSHLINKDYVKDGAVVIDVGTNFDEQGNLSGDVDSASVETIASAISPVPGGVGPVTTAVLLKHTCTHPLD